MITRQEIMDASKEFGLGAHIIEKDYVLGWLLAGISKHHVIGKDWIFKGGTCLKKCYFETYRFSEDLDFTLTQENNFNAEYLTESLRAIADFVYDETGLEIPKDLIKFEFYKNQRGKLSAEGKISYRGPMQQRGDLPRVKLDLTADEVIALAPVLREVQHPYSDRPTDGIFVQCYSFEEVFAEKIRALAERLRPRDLYDVIHLYRHDDVKLDHDVLNKTLKHKCDFKGILPPTAKRLRENRNELSWKPSGRICWLISCRRFRPLSNSGRNFPQYLSGCIKLRQRLRLRQQLLWRRFLPVEAKWIHHGKCLSWQKSGKSVQLHLCT